MGLTDEAIEHFAKAEYPPGSNSMAAHNRAVFKQGAKKAREKMVMPVWHGPSDIAASAEHGSHRRLVVCWDADDGEIFSTEAQRQSGRYWREFIPGIDCPPEDDDGKN